MCPAPNSFHSQTVSRTHWWRQQYLKTLFLEFHHGFLQTVLETGFRAHCSYSEVACIFTFSKKKVMIVIIGFSKSLCHVFPSLSKSTTTSACSQILPHPGGVMQFCDVTAILPPSLSSVKQECLSLSAFPQFHR